MDTWTVDQGPVLVWNDRILPMPVMWPDGAVAYEALAALVETATGTVTETGTMGTHDRVDEDDVRVDEDVIALIRAAVEGDEPTRHTISDRGFMHMQPVDLGEDRRVVVYQSSAAEEPKIWLKVVDHGIAYAHLTHEQARHLISQIIFLLALTGDNCENTRRTR